MEICQSAFISFAFLQLEQGQCTERISFIPKISMDVQGVQVESELTVRTSHAKCML